MQVLQDLFQVLLHVLFYWDRSLNHYTTEPHNERSPTGCRTSLIVWSWCYCLKNGYINVPCVCMCMWQRTMWQGCVLRASSQARTVSDHVTWCSPIQCRWLRPCWLVAVTAPCCLPSRRAKNNNSSRTLCRTTPFQVDDLSFGQGVDCGPLYILGYSLYNVI